MKKTYEYVKDNILTTTSFVEKFKAETKFEDTGLFASPLFLRADNAGTYRAVIALFAIKKEEKKTTLLIEQLISMDIKDASDISHEPAKKHFDKMGIDIRTPFAATRKGMDKERAKEYGQKVIPTMDTLRLKLLEDGSITKEEYMTYLKYALYSFSDEVAEAFATLSRLFLYTNTATIRCKSCQRQYRISTKSYFDGQIMKSRCPNCETINQNSCVKTGSIVTLRNDYMDMRNPKLREEVPAAPGQEDTKEGAEPIIEKESFSVDTRATISKNTAISGEKLKTKTLSQEALEEEWMENAAAIDDMEVEESMKEDIAAEPDATDAIGEETDEFADEEAEVTAKQGTEPFTGESQTVKESAQEDIKEEEPSHADNEAPLSAEQEDHMSMSASPTRIHGLGNVKRILETINTVSQMPNHPALIFSLCGTQGCGISTFLHHMTGYGKIKYLSPSFLEEYSLEKEEHSCFVIPLQYCQKLSFSAYENAKTLPQSSILFFTGTAEDMECFQSQNPLLCGLILYLLFFKNYKTDELFLIFKDKIEKYGLSMPELTKEETESIFSGKDAVKISLGAKHIFFLHMLNKPGKTELTKKELENEFCR